MNRSDEVQKFHKKVIILSHDRTQKEAYAIVERYYKKVHDTRMFKNYDSYKVSMCKRRKLDR